MVFLTGMIYQPFLLRLLGFKIEVKCGYNL